MADKLVFSDEFIADLDRRFAARPASHRQDIYFVATSPSRSGLRRWIEDAVAGVPEPGRSKLVSRLRADEHFINTLNELAVGWALRSVGGEAFYEHELFGVSPDWFVAPSDTTPAIVAEVWNKNFEHGRPSRRRLWLGLQERVRRIPAGYLVNVIAVGRQGPPRADVAKRIAARLQDWLVSDDVTVGTQREFDGYRFRVAGQTANGTAEMTLPGEGGAFTTAGVQKAVAAKVRRYEGVVDRCGGAFIVVVGHEVGTPVSRNVIRDLMAGRQGFEVAFDPLVLGEFADITLPMNAVDTPLELPAAASAVGWVELVLADEPDELPAVRLDVWSNPARRVELPVIPGAVVHG